MRVAYLLSWNSVVYGGVEKKIQAQSSCWEREGIEVQIFLVTENGDATKYLGEKVSSIQKRAYTSSFGKFISANSAFREAGSLIQEWKADLVYYRLSYPTWSVIQLGRKIPMIVELNNDILREVKRNYTASNLTKLILNNYLKFTIKSILETAVGAVAVTEELANKYPLKSGANTLVLSNSIDMSKVPSLRELTNKNELPRVAFLGSKEKKQGLDRVVDLAILTKSKLEFDVFGLNEPEFVPNNMKFHGFLKRENYLEILETCTVGLSTLCLYEKGLEEASSLKVREYLALGLPVIVAHKDTALQNVNQSWLLEIENNENNVELSSQRIVDFVYEQKGRRVLKNEVEDLIDSQKLEKQRTKLFKSII